MFNKLFLKDVLDRVLGTVAVVLLPIVLADGFNIYNVDWKATLSLVVAAVVATVLKAVVANTRPDTLGPASFVKK